MQIMSSGVMRFAEKLEREIARRGSSQSKLSRETGIHQTAISAMTRNERRPYMDQALQLARALGVPLDYLADDAQDEPPPASGLGEDERAVLDLYHALGLGRLEALRRLATGGETERRRASGPASEG